MTARTFTLPEVQAIARRAWEACQQACVTQVVLCSDKATPWNGAEQRAYQDVSLAIRDLQPPPDMGDIIGGEDDR